VDPASRIVTPKVLRVILARARDRIAALSSVDDRAIRPARRE
jgi:hypothetical protein